MAMKIDFTSKPLASQNNVKVTEGFLSLMGAGGKNGIEEIPLELLVPYENQPFRPYTSERLAELASDIAENGLLSPIIVRPMAGGKYQILAGHNRTQAGQLAGLNKIPAIIKEVDDDAAKLIVVNTNLNQREKLTYREKAFAYKMQLEAMKRKAGRPNKDNFVPLEQNYSREELAHKTGESQSQIQRYIRLTYLLDGLLDMVDDDKLPFRAAVNISYLPAEEQGAVFSYLSSHQISLTLEQSEQLKKQSQQGEIVTEQTLKDLLHPAKEEKPKKEKQVTIKIPARLFTSVKNIDLDEEKLERLVQFIETL